MIKGKTPVIDTRNARNKKTRNPGYQPGNHWVLCDRCGCAVREKDSKVTWEGYVVCPDDWEPRQPQDFVRSKEDRIAPEGNVRPDSNGYFVYGLCTTNTAVCDEAIADCAIADGPVTIPPSTFNMNTL